MAHTGEELCFTAEVFIVHRGKVLLRMHDKYRKWLSVGGHIEAGEDPTEAAVREVKEEIGLDVQLVNPYEQFTVREPTLRNLVPPVGVNRHQSGDGREHVTFVYFARSESDAIVKGDDPEQDCECRWVGKDELAGMDLLDNVREYATAALEKLGA